jgi:hypothetical protein
MSVPAWLQTLRDLRPANVVSALPRGSAVLLMSPRDLRRADPSPIPRITVPALACVPALLRAARDAGAVIGLAKPGVSMGEGPSPAQLAGALVNAADELGYGAPLFLASAPLPMPQAGGGDRLRDELQRFLDAGFTELAFASPAEVFDELIEALRIGLAGARERELPVALFARDADSAAPGLEALAAAGIAVDIVSLESGEGAESLGQPLELPREQLVDGVRGVELSAPILSAARQVLGDRVEPSRARELESLDELTALKLEAITYAEALRLLRAELFRGSAGRVMQSLASAPGY